MKKLITAVALVLIAPAATADTFLGIYGEISRWNADYSGNVGEPGIDVKSLGFDDQKANRFALTLEHGVPVLPNVKLVYTDITNSQNEVIDATFTLDGTTFTIGTEVATRFDLSHTDLILYYEVLDNVVELDLGLTVRNFNGYVSADSLFASKTANLNETIPMVYSKVRFNLPFSGFSAGAEGSFIKYDGNQLYDYTANVRYIFDGIVLDTGIEIGYRELSLDINEKVTGDITLKGPYVGLVMHF